MLLPSFSRNSTSAPEACACMGMYSLILRIRPRVPAGELSFVLEPQPLQHEMLHRLVDRDRTRWDERIGDKTALFPSEYLHESFFALDAARMGMKNPAGAYIDVALAVCRIDLYVQIRARQAPDLKQVRQPDCSNRAVKIAIFGFPRYVWTADALQYGFG